MDLFDYVMQTPANTNPAVLSSEISKAVEESQVQVDYAQNNPSAKDYIKNRPFYVKNGTRLRNTIEDFYNAGGDFGGNSDYSMTFIVNGEILSGTCSSFDSGEIKMFYLPSSENYKYVVRALSEVHTGSPSISCETADGTIVENWSIYPPEETEEIHYLDSKYLDPGILARIEKLESGALTVHVTDSNGTLSADKSYIEIMDAILAGTTVLVDYGINIIPLIGIINHNPIFGATMCVNDGTEATVSALVIRITKDNKVHNLSAQINLPPALPNPNALTIKIGSTTVTYDGSTAQTVTIADGTEVNY